MPRFLPIWAFAGKITLPIGFLALLLVLMGWSGMRGIGQVTESSTQLTKRYLPAISLLLNADRDLYQAFVAERSLLGGQCGQSCRGAACQSSGQSEASL
nr:hypothetical protein GCM10020185_12390 [Pseudomonas brassicacearum subsp. brassicacearum]